MIESILTGTAKIAIVREDASSGTEQTVIPYDIIGGNSNDADIEKDCHAFLTALSALTPAVKNGRMKEAWNDFVALHTAMVKKHGNEAITETLNKIRKRERYEKDYT